MGVFCAMMRLVILIELGLVTDGLADGQTWDQHIATSIASRGNKNKVKSFCYDIYGMLSEYC